MNCFSQTDLLPVEQAIRLMREAITPIITTETVPLIDALDRILSDDIHSTLNVPGHNNSAMDGYALCHQDIKSDASLKIIGHSLAGHPYKGVVQQGECVRIMTGAVLPEGADTVVMQENVSINTQSNSICINQSAKMGDNIRLAGEDIAVNSLVYKKGKRIGPVDIGLLASLGIAEVPVYKRLKVAVFSTGDELKPLTHQLQAGDIYDSNRPTLIALLSRLNVEIIDLGCIADDPQDIAAAFTAAKESADVVISSGGVSVGDADHTKEVLETLGKINFWKVAMKPGKPFAFGALQKQHSTSPTSWFFGLPGNPVSAVVTYHQLVLPSVRYLAGENLEDAPVISVRTQTSLKKQPGRTDYQRGHFKSQDGEIQISTTGNQSSGVLSSVAQANCYIVLEQERGPVEAGETVKVVLFDRFLQ